MHFGVARIAELKKESDLYLVRGSRRILAKIEVLFVAYLFFAPITSVSIQTVDSAQILLTNRTFALQIALDPVVSERERFLHAKFGNRARVRRFILALEMSHVTTF